MNQHNSISDIAAALSHFICTDILDQQEELGADDNLLMDVGVDSLGMLRVVGYLETQYQIKISPVYFTIENFRSVNAISRFISTLIAEQVEGENIGQ